MVQSADHVVVVEEGRVVAEGTPQAVRRSNEWFARFAATSAARPGGRAVSDRCWHRSRSFLAGLASGAVLVLAFLVPSVQEQWNLWRSGRVIDQFARIGHQLLAKGQFAAAERAFDKAVEMSEGRRLDLIEAQLQAHVQRVNENPEWRGAVPEDLSDGDFLYLLEMQRGAVARARACRDARGVRRLARERRQRPVEASKRLDEALTLDPTNAAAHVNLGNLRDDRGDSPGPRPNTGGRSSSTATTRPRCTTSACCCWKRGGRDDALRSAAALCGD